jgi:hypothetical protein
MAKKKTVIERKPLKIKKTRKLSEEHKEKLRQRLAEMRAKKKPAEYKNVAKSVLNLPDDDKYSFKNIKAWIKENKLQANALVSQSKGRGVTPQARQQALNAADGKKAYIRYMEHYLRTGDWIGLFSGANEEHKVVPKCVAMAYHPDGTPKRSAGVFYSDINMVWKQDMIEANYVPVETISQCGTVAITDKQFTANL